MSAAAGRVSLGPWYTLPDEHLVSGESLLRNLELGLERAGELGTPLAVGYLPDQFGHTAQMPQILALHGDAERPVHRPTNRTRQRDQQRIRQRHDVRRRFCGQPTGQLLNFL